MIVASNGYAVEVAEALENAVIAVTNAGHGYGHAIARALGKAGASVIVIDQNAEAASMVASELDAMGVQAIPIKADCSVQLEVGNSFDKILGIYGNLDGLVHVADAVSHTHFRRMAEAEWMDLFDHARATFLLLNHLTRRCKNSWATVVLPPADGLEPQTQSLRSSLTGLVFGLSEVGVRVNAVLPSRASGGMVADKPLAEAVLSFALPSSQGLSGATVKVVMPALSETNNDLSEQR